MKSVFTGRRRHGLGVALATVVAMSGIVAASASALRPEYFPLEKNAFTLVGGEVTFEQSGGITGIRCKKASGPFEVQNVKEFKGNIAFKECSTVHFAGSCTTTGAAEGEIVAMGITLRLEYLAKATHEVGVVMNYKSSGEAATFTSFKCKSLISEATLRGPIVAKLTPVNTFTTHFTLGLKGSSGLQEITEYENESGAKVTARPEMTVNGGAFNLADVNATTLELQGIKAAEIIG